MCTRKTSLSLLLFFVSIIYFTIRKVNPLCEKNVLFAGRSSQNHASWTCYVYHHEKSRGSWLVVRGSWLVKPCLMDLLCISPFIRGGPPKAPFIGELTAKGGLRG